MTYRSVMIPKLFVQVSPSSIHPPLERAWREMFPDWQYQKFDERGMIEYFQSNPLNDFPKMEEIFWSFEREEHRINLFAYFYLFHNGGVFLDKKAIVNKNLESLVSENVVFVNSWQNYYNYRYIFTGFIMVEAGNELMYAALENCYKAVTKPWEQCHYWFDKEMYRITRMYPKKVKILQQHNSLTSSKVSNIFGVSFIYNENETIMTIPDN